MLNQPKLTLQNRTPSPKHDTACSVVQSPEPIYMHGQAYLSKQPLWCEAGDCHLAHGRSWARVPATVGALHAIFFSTLPSPLGRFILHLPHHPRGRLGLNKPKRKLHVMFVLHFSTLTRWAVYEAFQLQSMYSRCH